MSCCADTKSADLGHLVTPCRNNYFYGKLLDEFHLEMEQSYFNRHRWLLNRLSLGSGVLCGLDVKPAGKLVRIEPGVAIDALGREIIVPDAREVDPRRLTDDCCSHTGEEAKEGDDVELCLAYHECGSDMAPVLVGECETERRCAPSTICERFCVVVQKPREPRLPSCPLPRGALRFPDGVLATSSYSELVKLISNPCPTIDEPSCVPLARIRIPGQGADIAQDMISPQVRPLVYSNALLFELLLCLWARVERCCGPEQPQGVVVPPQIVDPPRIVRFGPPNAARLREEGNDVETEWWERWRVQPHLEITFEREMQRESLENPNSWLRLWKIDMPSGLAQPAVAGPSPPTATPLELQLDATSIASSGEGFTVRYNVVHADEAPVLDGGYYVAQIWSHGHFIQALNLQDLDAEFPGTGLSQELLDRMWNGPGSVALPLNVQVSAVDTVELPSGDGEEGGRFHSWFWVGP